MPQLNMQLSLLAVGIFICQQASVRAHVYSIKHAEVVASVRVANFREVLGNGTAVGNFDLDEDELNGVVNVSSSGSEARAAHALYGTHFLQPAQAQQLAWTVSQELPEVPPAQAARTPVVQFPGMQLEGHSVLRSLSSAQPRRIPTVFAPFHAGVVIPVAAREERPGVTLAFSNMTLLLPNATYDGIYDSGFMDFFELGKAARFCFWNSILVVKSCEGYTPDTYHMWCCTQRQCGILYTQQQIEDLGYDLGGLDFLQCYAAEDAEIAAPATRRDFDVNWAVGGGVAAGVAIALVGVLYLGAVYLCRSRRRSGKAGGGGDPYACSSSVVDGALMDGVVSSGTEAGAAVTDGTQLRAISDACQYAPAATACGVWAGCSVHGENAGVTPPAGTAASAYGTAADGRDLTSMQLKAQLVEELDDTWRRGELFLGQFVVLPATERREGGQGVVQFMRRARTEDAVAVKFFLSRREFETEVQLYRVAVLRSMMPAVRLEVGNGDGAERNGRGYAWPPCMVLERGESLQEWKARTQPAFSTILDALCLIAERLTQLHGSGWVHRDLKPGNVLRLPGQHSWTLMDFGCAAPTGLSVPLTFSLFYAPPEVALAIERGARTIVADTAADMWAFGVMAFELLTGAPLFPAYASAEAMRAQLCGREALPWEAGAPGQPGKLAQLRVLRGAILQCLQRWPEQRPTAREVMSQWRRLFDPQSMGRQL